jgi:hypothetical protein
LDEPVFAFELVPVGPEVFELLFDDPTVTTPFEFTPEEEFDGVAELPEDADEPDPGGDVAAERT